MYQKLAGIKPKLLLLDLINNDIRDVPFGALRGNFY